VVLVDLAPKYALLHAYTHYSPPVSRRPISLFFFPHTQRFVIVANDDKIERVIVEEKPGELTVTEASQVLAQL
jgi:hypothetical protein